jgi:hypothetical protein
MRDSRRSNTLQSEFSQFAVGTAALCVGTLQNRSSDFERSLPASWRLCHCGANVEVFLARQAAIIAELVGPMGRAPAMVERSAP